MSVSDNVQESVSEIGPVIDRLVPPQRHRFPRFIALAVVACLVSGAVYVRSNHWLTPSIRVIAYSVQTLTVHKPLAIIFESHGDRAVDVLRLDAPGVQIETLAVASVPDPTLDFDSLVAQATASATKSVPNLSAGHHFIVVFRLRGCSNPGRSVTLKVVTRFSGFRMPWWDQSSVVSTGGFPGDLGPIFNC